MTNIPAIDNVIDEAVQVQDVDMTETGTSGGGGFVIPAGAHNARMISYIEMGKQVHTFNGKPKPAAPQARVEFEFYSQSGEVLGSILTFALAISNAEKAKFKVMFDRYQKVYPNVNGKPFNHMARALTLPINIEVTLREKDGKQYNDIVYSSIRAPMKFDAETGAQCTIPPMDMSKLRMFLWNNPTQEGWDSLFIEGTRDDGTSKNFIQNEILTKAVNYAGSPLELMLTGFTADEPVVPSATATAVTPP